MALEKEKAELKARIEVSQDHFKDMKKTVDHLTKTVKVPTLYLLAKSRAIDNILEDLRGVLEAYLVVTALSSVWERV